HPMICTRRITSGISPAIGEKWLRPLLRPAPMATRPGRRAALLSARLILAAGAIRGSAVSYVAGVGIGG
ncbi:hypothetical protein BDQ12DRAFT_694640, partial [Crucibulum laeve]